MELFNYQKNKYKGRNFNLKLANLQKEKSFVKNSKKTQNCEEVLVKIENLSSSVQDYNHNFYSKNSHNNSSVNENNLNISIHQKYLCYSKLSQEEKDKSKTDYTYAHSFSYSPLVPYKDRFNWTIPNMSRPSISYNRAFLEREKVYRKVIENVPVSKLKLSSVNNKVTINSGMNNFNLNQDELIHSTPIKKSDTSVKYQKSRIEYSDDDEEENELNETVQNVYSKNYNNSKLTNNAENIDNFDERLSEDEEELTIIRRINRVVVTTIRNIFTSDVDKNQNGFNHSYRNTTINHRRYKSTLTNQNKRISNKCYWVLALLFGVLLSSCFYYFTRNSIEVSNLLEDLSHSSSFPVDLFNYKSFFNKLKTDEGKFSEDMSKITSEIHSLRMEVLAIKEKRVSTDNSNSNQPNINEVNDSQLNDILERLSKLEKTVITCCKSNATQNIEKEIQNLVNTKLLDIHQTYDKKLELEVEKLKNYLMDYSNNLVNNIKATNIGNFSVPNEIDTDSIQNMIKSAIFKYDADKTGEADFALESAGAWIVSTRCSETYELYPASYKILGFTFWRSSNTPRVVIQSGVVPGECWCFKGSEGRIAIRLSVRIIPSSFTYEHIPIQLSRDGNIMSAPASFDVYGLKTEDDLNPELLGEYHYSTSGEPLQRFDVQNTETALHTFRYIELKVKSNQGHPDYTCLYRFRVHGKPIFDKN